MKNLILSVSIICTSFISSYAQPNLTTSDADNITGKWVSSENNLEVEIFKEGNEYIAKVVWFKDTKNKSTPENERLDLKNPRKDLRGKRIVGMQVMHGLVYNADDEEWQQGRIYDPSSGKEWNAKAWLTEAGILKLRAFWHFEFLGENMSFSKV